MISRSITKPSVLAAALLLATPLPLRAEVLDQSAEGFTAGGTYAASSTPARLWARLANISSWWSGEHSFSGDARNLSLSLTLGGCFCETLGGGGFARHLEVALAEPPNLVVLRGALGPLLTQGVTGALRIEIKPDRGGSQLTWRFRAGGYFEGGAARFAAPVDHVLSEQMARLTGNPPPPKPSP